MCSNITDKYSISNNYAKLDYPIGLFSSDEMALMSTGFSKTGENYHSLSPSLFSGSQITANVTITTDGRVVGMNGGVGVSYGVRPAISLKPEIEYTDGDGTKNNPYIIDTSS